MSKADFLEGFSSCPKDGAVKLMVAIRGLNTGKAGYEVGGCDRISFAQLSTSYSELHNMKVIFHTTLYNYILGIPGICSKA
jgi:hypothetical protein